MINTSYAYKLKYRIFKAQHYAPWKNTHLVMIKVDMQQFNNFIPLK